MLRRYFQQKIKNINVECTQKDLSKLNLYYIFCMKIEKNLIIIKLRLRKKNSEAIRTFSFCQICM